MYSLSYKFVVLLTADRIAVFVFAMDRGVLIADVCLYVCLSVCGRVVSNAPAREAPDVRADLDQDSAGAGAGDQRLAHAGLHVPQTHPGEVSRPNDAGVYCMTRSRCLTRIRCLTRSRPAAPEAECLTGGCRRPAYSNRNRVEFVY